MDLTPYERRRLLRRLAKAEGRETVTEMIERACTDSVVPGICIDESCGSNQGCEPDAEANYCDACGKQTVVSCLVLEGLI